MRASRPRTIKLSVVALYNLASFALTWVSTQAVTGSLLHYPGSGVTVLASLYAVYFFLMWRDLYSRRYHYYLRHTYRIVVRNSLVAAAVVVLVAAASSALDRDRPFLATNLAAGLASFSLMHVAEFAWIRHLSRLGYFRKNVLTVGTPDERLPLERYFQDVGRTRRYVGTVRLAESGWEWRPAAGGRRPIGSPAADLRRIMVRERVAQVLFLLGPGVERKLLQEMTQYCRAFSISYYIVANVADVPNAAERNGARHGGAGAEDALADMFDYVPVVEAFSAARDSLTSISIKRMLDIAVALVSIVASIPLWLIIACAIKVEDGGPVFYVSRRIGKDGGAIRFYKFRTMVVDAVDRKEQLRPFNERGDGPLFKMKDDPRVTRVGRLLRRLSLDELPQFLSVLLGTMSLTGPRPHLPEEVAQYEESDYLRLECMPGIVGLPQIAGRSTLGFRQWMELDLRYRKEWSLVLDARIALRALRIVLSAWLGRDEGEYSPVPGLG